jgi:ethanolaminephosphotransferase
MGMLIDHGCDAMTTFLFTQTLGTIMGLGIVNLIIENAFWFVMIWLMAALPFYLNTWEEYYTGELVLPVVNGVNEGTAMACFFMTLTAIIGRDFWFYKVFGLIQFNHLMLTSSFLAGVVFGLHSLIKVVREYGGKRLDVYHNLLIFVFMIFTLYLVIFLADSKIIAEYPKVIVLLYGFGFAKLMGHLQLAHLADAKFMQFRKSLMTTYVLLGSISILNALFKVSVVNIDYVIVILLCLHIIGKNVFKV